MGARHYLQNAIRPIPADDAETVRIHATDGHEHVEDRLYNQPIGVWWPREVSITLYRYSTRLDHMILPRHLRPDLPRQIYHDPPTLRPVEPLPFIE